MATIAALARPLERARTLATPAGAATVAEQLPAALLGVAVVTPVASANGGWGATSWGWISLGLAWLAILALLLRPVRALGRVELVGVGAASLFALFTLLSAVWSHDAGSSVLSFERLLVYVTAVVAVLATVRAEWLPRLLASVWLGSSLVCGYALLTRLYPNRFPAPLSVAGNRLAAPVGYWNGLGLLAAIALVAAVGVVVTSRSRTLAALAGLAVVPVVLALYFTFSRGAYLALGVGLVVALAFDPRRLRTAAALLALAPWAALAIRHTSSVAALVDVNVPAAQAAVAGGQLVRHVLPYVAGAGVSALGVAELGRRVEAPARVRTALTAGLALLGVAAVVGGLGVAGSRYGGPAGFVRHAWGSFTTDSPPRTTDLNQRLFSFGGTHRASLFRVAWDDFTAHPLTGSGAGTYVQYWLRDRPVASQAVNAHNLYAETLAELGPVGLVLLLGFLLSPLAAAVRARRQPAVPVVAAAYCAFLVHAFFDWDWQLPGVSLAAVLLGAGLLLTGRREQAAVRLRSRAAYAVVAVLALVAAVSAVTLVANRAAARAAVLTARDDTAGAIASARRAARLEPWSSQPWQLLGEAQLAAGSLDAARASFETALGKNPNSWELWLDLALATPQRSARLAAARHALELDPLSNEIASIRGALGLPSTRP